jgi:arsenite-transporting ATPase
VATIKHPVGLAALADELAKAGRGLIMGKGGKTVHLSTTDPAAHLAGTLEGAVEGLHVDRIDPLAETQRYVDKIMATKGAGLTEDERALMLEDLKSPCTEEVAVFHAFSRVVAEARSAYVVLDTAPTGHSMLLMDATGAYHRQMVRELEGHGPAHIITPLMRLQDPEYIKIILAAHTQDPLLQARLTGEAWQMDKVENGLAKKTFVLPWLARPPIGVQALSALVAHR